MNIIYCIMKTLKILFILGVLLASNSVFAQVSYSEKVTVKWPYLYQDFQKGTLYFDGGTVSKGSFNINLADQSLVFFNDDQRIREVSSEIDLDSLVLGTVTFYKSDAFYEVIAQKGPKVLLRKVRIDVNAANDTGGGYGTGSSTDATTNLNSVEVANYTQVPYEIVKLEVGKGKVLDTITAYYIASSRDGEYLRATKKSFSTLFPDADVKSIIKKKKLKLKNGEDLVQLFKACSK